METINNRSNQNIFSFEAIGTHWVIETVLPISEIVKQRIADRIEIFDQTYSRFRKDSLITKITQATNGGFFHFPEDSIPMFDFYDVLFKITDGAVNPLIGRRLEQLGYDADYSLKPESDLRINDSENPDWLLEVTRDGNSIYTKKQLVIDVGAVGKGYLVDIISEILQEEGFENFIVNGSGDIRHFGKSMVRIGMEDPENRNHAIGVVNIKNQAVCASATNTRSWSEGLHHVLDARTGMPVNNVIATWAITQNAMLADGLATALFYADAKRLMENFTFSSIRMFKDRTLEVTDDFNGELFFKN